MELNLISGKLEKIQTDSLVFFLFEKEKLPQELISLDKKLNGIISLMIKKHYFKGSQNENYLVHCYGKIKADNITLVGLGEKGKFNQEKLRLAVAQVLGRIKNLNHKNVTLVLPEINLNIIEDIGVISLISLYNFLLYKNEVKEKTKKIQKVDIYVGAKSISKYQEALHRAKIIGESVNWTKDLVNHPANFLTPQELAKAAKKLVDKNTKINVFGRYDLGKMKMGLILGVSKGSDEEPKLIVLDYKPKKYKNTIAIVGKGLTFDSGGISLKPSQDMHEMKNDMAGAAAVLGAIEAITKLKPNLRIVAIVPAVENLPSGKALKPGDILRSASGKNVEVINTDAEGRMVLADALYYAQSYKPSAIIDLATLTGSIISTLGHEAAGIFSNNKNLIQKIEASAKTSGEKVWQLPIWDEFKEGLKSEIADLSNAGVRHEAGAINAALFLGEFTGKYPWAHLDIAGTAFVNKPKSYQQKGATGYGVRLLIDFIENWA